MNIITGKRKRAKVVNISSGDCKTEEINDSNNSKINHRTGKTPIKDAVYPITCRVCCQVYNTADAYDQHQRRGTCERNIEKGIIFFNMYHVI